MPIQWKKWKDPLRRAFKKAKEEGNGIPSEGGGAAVVGPIGIIPLHEGNLPSRIFNFWMGHADFDLTRPRVEAIELVPGVETLDVWTRYRFRLGIGRSFDEEKVKKAVDRLFSPPPTVSGMDAVAKLASLSSPGHWAVYRMADGTLETASGGTVQEAMASGQAFAMGAEDARWSW